MALRFGLLVKVSFCVLDVITFLIFYSFIHYYYYFFYKLNNQLIKKIKSFIPNININAVQHKILRMSSDDDIVHSSKTVRGEIFFCIEYFSYTFKSSERILNRTFNRIFCV